MLVVVVVGGRTISKMGLNLKNSDKSPGSQPKLIKIGTWHKFMVLNSKITSLGTQ